MFDVKMARLHETSKIATSECKCEVLHSLATGVDGRLKTCHTGVMNITDLALDMIADCLSNGITEPEDIISYLIDDELNAVTFEAVCLVQNGNYVR